MSSGTDGIRVLLVVPTLDPGGAERLVVELATGLPQHGVECAVCYLDGQGLLAGDIEAAQVDVQSLRLPHKAWPACHRLRAVIERFVPSVIHAHMPRAAFWSARAKRPDIPLLYTEHNTQKVYPGWSHRLFQSFLPRTTHIIAVSDAAASEFRARWRWSEGSTTVIPTGAPVTDLRVDATPSEVRARHGIRDEPLVCAVGAVRPPKSYHYLVRAIALLRNEGLPVRALIVGSTDVVPAEAARLSHEIHERQMDGVVQVTGHVANSYDYVSAADVFAMSSVQEGLPRVLLEAMAAGKPVVATDVGGCAEAVVHGETGLIVPPENPQALADAIRYVLEHPDEARRMGEAGRRRVEEHFTVEAMIRKHIEVYYRVLARAQ